MCSEWCAWCNCYFIVGSLCAVGVVEMVWLVQFSWFGWGWNSRGLNNFGYVCNNNNNNLFNVHNHTRIITFSLVQEIIICICKESPKPGGCTLIRRVILLSNSSNIIGRSRGACPAHAPLWDPILLFLHTFSVKSAHVRGPHPPVTGPHPPYGKSWIRHWIWYLFLLISAITLYILNYWKEN